MRLLLDQNIPPQASNWLKPFHVNCLHVRDASLKTATDNQIWKFAHLDDRIILTKDGDFAAFARCNLSITVKIVWLKAGNLRNREFKLWLVRKWPLICELLEEGHSIIEVR